MKSSMFNAMILFTFAETKWYAKYEKAEIKINTKSRSKALVALAQSNTVIAAMTFARIIGETTDTIAGIKSKKNSSRIKKGFTFASE